ncbi:MAG: beta-N-acetylhexosaminidase [Hyphomicrobiales bacterium]|nr:MAG: beta-N-acetylhexosaminidase [Hyphomicrobiales bacterium]
MTAKAFITGVAGLSLSEDEKAFLGNERPWGLILFARNCRDADQIRELVAEFRDVVGDLSAPVLIDQEGGRVQRLRPPLAPIYPPGAVYGALHAMDTEEGLAMARLGARLIAADLHALGIDVDCLPVLDVPATGSHDVIGDRAYGRDPKKIATIGRAAAEGLLAGGVLPVIKHIPGHGRAMVDSHLDLPRVDTPLETLRETDFPPFKMLNDMPLAMTAHVVYSALDTAPATTSARIISEIIRGEMGFDGCLMSDDLSMKALGGDFGDRTRAALAAGCDLVLHCNGDFEEMRAIAEATPELTGEASRRANAALDRRRAPEALDIEAARIAFAEQLEKATRIA